jgi:hypothetical protein
MKRLAIALAFCFVAVASAADDKVDRVTGTVELGGGATAPAKFRLEVEILKVEPGKVITFLKRVGQLRTETVKSFPARFECPYPKSTLKDTKPESFIMRALVYELLPKGSSKLVYQTPDDEVVKPFTADGRPRQNVQVVVKPIAKK